MCLSLLSIVVIKHNQMQLGKERAYFTIIERSQGKNSEQELGSRNWGSGHGGQLLTGLLFIAYLAYVLKALGPPAPGWHHPQ